MVQIGAGNPSCRMPRITEELVRKRAEHNNGEISTLEELSLHQQEIEKIEYLDTWCRHLKILYLQNNLIPRIENVGRLKDLQYLNIALNNIETIENLEGCEFLQKLDFTVNFIGNLLSVETLRSNIHLGELYLTGNPCTDYEGYREYVVATLPQLHTLDGKEITRSERIVATQKVQELREGILVQQKEHTRKREREKEAFQEKENRTKDGSSKKPGFDGRWYTDPQAHLQEEEREEEEEEYTPENRLKTHRDMTQKKRNEHKEPENKLEMPKRVRRLERDGKMLNVNEGRYDFQLRDEGSAYVLEVKCPKYMESSLLECDVQVNYIRLTIKSKILQLVLDEEVSPDTSSARRSQTTGHLVLTLPKVKPTLAPAHMPKDTPSAHVPNDSLTLKPLHLPKQEVCSRKDILLFQEKDTLYHHNATPAADTLHHNNTTNNEEDVPPLI